MVGSVHNIIYLYLCIIRDSYLFFGFTIDDFHIEMR
ncbi:hypothetical protein SAMN06266787_11912 [Halorubrum ezzemoulense]|uniref:Uncharacterized protein n=1 Tax=Halorubrum ezzemoulense TaxID=337243 RepID=A0A238YU70_HALEZ|nr:hypothetical protein SAMN06266787_11912 [Halorubrum ezzemoulense]